MRPTENDTPYVALDLRALVAINSLWKEVAHGASHWLYVSQGKHVDVLEEDGAVVPCAEPIHTSAVILSPGTLVLDLSTNDPS